MCISNGLAPEVCAGLTLTPWLSGELTLDVLLSLFYLVPSLFQIFPLYPLYLPASPILSPVLILAFQRVSRPSGVLDGQGITASQG